MPNFPCPVDWDKALSLNQNQMNKSFKMFFNIFETLLGTFAPLKQFSNSAEATIKKLNKKQGYTTSSKDTETE